MRYFRWLLLVAIGPCLLNCSRQEPATSPASTSLGTSLIEPGPSLAALNRGARLFQEHCAQCHGPEAQGHPDWQTPGVIAAPPLNGTGNDWKRSRKELVAIIHEGAKRNGVTVMPGWKGRLTDPEIEDLIAWFQALWAPETYAKWQRTQVAGTGG